ncbi:solute carrier family 35 member G1 isoform X2 [Galendromus occidentalis]|nr:solute carrier family 35 member G1 isoform X2 [Galendromus occidentalis]
MYDRGVQTSRVDIVAIDSSIQTQPKLKSVTNDDVEANHIIGQPSLVQLWKGLLFASMSALFFSVCSVIVKNLKYMPVTQLSSVRFCGILLLSLPAAITRSEPLFGTPGTRWMMLVRALAGAISLMLRFFAFQHMPLGDASTIIFSVPIFVTVMARIFLKEACSVFHVVTCFLTLFGIAMISKLPMLFGNPDDAQLIVGENNLRLYGILAALSSCVFAASVIILLRKLKETDPYVIMFNFGWIALILSAVATFIIHGQLVPPRNLVDAGLLVVLAVLSFFGQLMLTFSLRTEQAGPVSVMRATVDIVLVFIWQVLFFEEIPDLVTIAGVILVMTCVIFTGFRKWAMSLPEQSNTRRKLKWCL